MKNSKMKKSVYPKILNLFPVLVPFMPFFFFKICDSLVKVISPISCPLTYHLHDFYLRPKWNILGAHRLRNATLGLTHQISYPFPTRVLCKNKTSRKLEPGESHDMIHFRERERLPKIRFTFMFRDYEYSPWKILSRSDRAKWGHANML